VAKKGNGPSVGFSKGRVHALEIDSVYGHKLLENHVTVIWMRWLLHFFREAMRDFHNLLNRDSSPCSCCWVQLNLRHIPEDQSMYLPLVEGRQEPCSWMRCPELMLCSTTSDSPGCLRCMCQLNGLSALYRTGHICMRYYITPISSIVSRL
jgi:hypothetical protein